MFLTSVLSREADLLPALVQLSEWRHVPEPGFLEWFFRFLEQPGHQEVFYAGLFGALAGVFFFALRRLIAKLQGSGNRDRVASVTRIGNRAERRNTSDGITEDAPVQPSSDQMKWFGRGSKKQCRWKLAAGRSGTSINRWICLTCGVDAFTKGKKPPRECKRQLKPYGL